MRVPGSARMSEIRRRGPEAFDGRHGGGVWFASDDRSARLEDDGLLAPSPLGSGSEVRMLGWMLQRLRHRLFRWSRRSIAEASHLVVGSTGSGKSEGELVDLVRLARGRVCA